MLFSDKYNNTLLLFARTFMVKNESLKRWGIKNKFDSIYIGI